MFLERQNALSIYSVRISMYIACTDGSADFSNLSTLLVLSWDGQLKKRLNFDRSIKRIAVDPSDRFLVALALDESGALDVVKYSI